MWCDIFHLFLGRNKKKPVIEAGCRLNIAKVILLISDVYFDILKHAVFLRNLFSLYQNIFLSFVVGRKKSLSFHRKDTDFANGIVLLAC